MQSTLVPFSSIIIGERFRKDYKNIEQLAESIKEHGLFHYPVIDDNNILIAGGRRMAALQLLGWEEIPVTFRKDISESKLREMELEENLQRENLTWQEEVNLKAEITRLKKELYGEKGVGRGAVGSSGVSNKDIAEMLGESQANLSMDLTLAKAMDQMPELAECKTKDDARKKLKQLQEKLIVEELSKRHSAKVENQTVESKYVVADRSFRIQDAFEGLKNLQQDKEIKLINVDTPYGIDLNNIKKGDNTGIVEHNYQEWEKDDFINKCRTIMEECFRVANDDTFMLWWFAIQWYEPLSNLLSETGWKFDPIPCLWYAGDQGQTNQPEIYLGRSYEPFFVARKGRPVIYKRGRSNVFARNRVSSTSKIHPTEKPIELMKDIFETFASPGCKILVPFLGSGNDILAGFQTQNEVFGFDLNKEVKKRFLIRVAEMEVKR